jgi:plastocyanin
MNGKAIIAGEMVNSWMPRALAIAVGERVTWRWNIPLSSGEIPKVKIQQTISDGRVEYNGVGFQSKTHKAVNGEWSYDFLIPGTYYYSSGYIESSESIALTGMIVVSEASSDRNVPVNVFVGTEKAIHVPTETPQFITEMGNCNSLDSLGLSLGN